MNDLTIGPATAWPAPRQLPSCYPGTVPAHDYLLVDGAVHPLRFDGTVARYLSGDGSWLDVDAMLAERGLPGMEHRCGIATYGANRNPATLVVKMDHYAYRSPGQGCVMPVLRGSLPKAEALAAGLSSQGYFYADLALYDDDVVADELEVWINLADPDQLRVLHESEGVGTWYRVVVLPPVRLQALNMSIRPLAYVTEAAALVPPGHAVPVAVSVPAIGRRVPALDPIRLWDVLLDGWNLHEIVAGFTGIPPGPTQGAELMKYLNGQWWYQHNTGQPPLVGAVGVITAVQSCIDAQSRPLFTLARLEAAGAVLEAGAAYAAGAEHGLVGAPRPGR